MNAVTDTRGFADLPRQPIRGHEQQKQHGGVVKPAHHYSEFAAREQVNPAHNEVGTDCTPHRL